MEPRTGKTKTLIDWASILYQKGRVKKVCVVAPNGVLGVWQDEIKAHCPHPNLTIVWDREARSYVRLPIGVKKLVFLVINYDAFAHPSNRRRILRELKKWGIDLIILDESHLIKTPSAKKTTALISLAWTQKKDGTLVENIPFRAIATGTAITKKKRVYDIYAQWKFLNPQRFSRWPTFREFKSHFVVEIDKGNYKMWTRNMNENQLHRLVHKDSFAIKRSECFDLPPRDDQIVRVKLSAKTTRIYDELADEMVAEVLSAQEAAREAQKYVRKIERALKKTEKGTKRYKKLQTMLKEAQGEARSAWRITASIPLVATLRLCQLTSGIARIEDDDENKKLIRVGNEKLNALKDIVDPLFEAEEKIVIAARFRADLAAVQKYVRSQKVKCWVIAGGIPRQERDRAIKAFRAHKGAGVMLIQPAAASLGIDLSTASTMVWYSLTPSYVHFSQSCDRIALSDRPTSYLYLIAEGTYDEQLYEVLKGDGEVVQMINRSPDALRRNYKVKRAA